MENYYITESGDKVEIVDEESIDLSCENIVEIVIIDLSICKYLYLNRNKLKSVDLNLTKCETLYLSHNILESVKLNLPKCTTLCLDHNRLKSVSLTLLKCEDIYLNNNFLESVDLYLPECDELYLHYNSKLETVKLDLPNVTILYSDSIKFIQSNVDVVMGFDGIPIIVDSEKKLGEFTIVNGRYKISKNYVFIASRDGYHAHGNTVKKAIEDCNFKFLHATIDIGPYFAECKEKGVMSVSDYRLITGACESGCKHFLESKCISSTEMKFDDVMELLEENKPYGWNKIKKLI